MKRMFSTLSTVLLALSLSMLMACSGAPPKEEPVGVPPKPEDNYAPRKSTEDDLKDPAEKPDSAPASESAKPEAAEPE